MKTKNKTPRLVLGPDSLQQLGDLIRENGHKVLLVHGHRPVEDGLLETVRCLLNKEGIPHANLGQILPNPKYGSVKRGIEVCRQEHCDLILSLGGGSTLQCAKGIALGALYKGDVWDFWTGRKKPTKALPVASILTDPATGDELNSSCTIVRKGKQRTIHSPQALCAFAILDPNLSQYPWYPTMCQGFELFVHDFSHAMDADEKGRKDAVDVLKQLLANIHALEKDLKNVEARDGLFRAGVLSHQLKSPSESGFTSLAGDLAFRFSLTRGTALSSLFLSWWDQLAKGRPEQLQLVAEDALGCNSLDKGRQAIVSLLQEMKMADSIPASGLTVTDKQLKGLTKDKSLRKILLTANRPVSEN